MNRMFKFYNKSASSIRSITVANCLAPTPDDAVDADAETYPADQVRARADSIRYSINFSVATPGLESDLRAFCC